MMLCDRCSQVFRGPCRHGQQDHYHSVRELEQAAFDKCHICRVLWQAISDKAPKDVRVSSTEAADHSVVPSKPISKSWMRHKVLYTDGISELSFTVDKNGVVNGGRSYLFCLQNTRDGHKLLGKSESSRSMTWDESINVAAGWLSVCQRDHRSCAAIIPPDGYLPKRLLSFGRSDSKKVQLVMNPGLQLGQIRYTTLSHCWGSSKPLTLTSKSLAMLQAGIKITELPRTFRDAIYTSKSLGIQFIWIDSLCIFQDSKHDWAEQAPHSHRRFKVILLPILTHRRSASSKICHEWILNKGELQYIPILLPCNPAREFSSTKSPAKVFIYPNGARKLNVPWSNRG